MKLSLSWMREWIEADAGADAIAEALTRRGFYVEGIETHGPSFTGVVVARVLEVHKHPNADKLSLCRVDSGAGELRVVCGAPNVRAGMVVPLATVGAKLPGGLVIKDGATAVVGAEPPCAPAQFANTASFGTAEIGAAAVPEPGSLALLLGGVLGLASRRAHFFPRSRASS